MSVSPRGPLSAVVGSALEYVDADGERWVVSEHDCRAIPGATAARCLIFMSDSAFRRVYHFPADWRTLSPVALAALSWGR